MKRKTRRNQFNLKSFFSISSEWIPTIRRLANDFISEKSICVAVVGSSCGVLLLLFVHIIQIFNDNFERRLCGTGNGVDITWSCDEIGADVTGANSILR